MMYFKWPLMVILLLNTSLIVDSTMFYNWGRLFPLITTPNPTFPTRSSHFLGKIDVSLLALRKNRNERSFVERNYSTFYEEVWSVLSWRRAGGGGDLTSGESLLILASNESCWMVHWFIEIRFIFAWNCIRLDEIWISLPACLHRSKMYESFFDILESD